MKKIWACRKTPWVCINRHLGKMWVRLFLLLLAAPLAYCVGGYLSGIMESHFPVDAIDGSISEASRQAAEKIKSHEYMRKVFTPTAYSLTFFLALWWFRTYDSLQRDWRANFEAGVNHVASDTPIRIEIGTAILINVSERTSAYNREIAIAFTKRLKRSPADTDKNKDLVANGYRWGYAQHMLKWLQNQNEKRDLDFLDLRYQEFTSTTAKITGYEIMRMHSGDDLLLDLAYCNFANPEEFFGDATDAHADWENSDRDIEVANKSPTLQIAISRRDFEANS